MRLQKRQLSGREKDEASIRLLTQLREKLYSDNSSVARRAAFNLSWMQEDGLDILKETLFSKTTRRAKSAAAYGLRRMHGRMKKSALEVFKEGLKHTNNDTRNICENALSQLAEKVKEKTLASGAPEVGNIRIKEIPRKTRKRKRAPQRTLQRSPQRGRRRTPKDL
ncbi:MAG: hypothetical protein JSV82_01225 [Planctomycetota bacterium]|nr:MAG: hypothetical protein JSV82_01225 [Planctomycetota bacterium]